MIIMDTVPTTLFRKYCSKSHRGCTLTQHFGFRYFNHHDTAKAVADSNWVRATLFCIYHAGFAMRFDAELLLGQVSYKQKSDIYNYYHKYERTKKTLGTRFFPRFWQWQLWKLHVIIITIRHTWSEDKTQDLLSDISPHYKVYYLQILILAHLENWKNYKILKHPTNNYILSVCECCSNWITN